MKGATRNLHVPLSATLYDSLRREALRQGRPTTQLARDAILRLLEEQRQEATRRDLAEYIQRVAGTKDDLDPSLEQRWHPSKRGCASRWSCRTGVLPSRLRHGKGPELPGPSGPN